MKKLLLLFVAVSLSTYCFSQDVEGTINSLNAEFIVHYEDLGAISDYWQIKYNSDNKVIVITLYDKSSNNIENTRTVDPKNISSVSTQSNGLFGLNIKMICNGKDIKFENKSGDVSYEGDLLFMLDGTDDEITKMKSELVQLFLGLGATLSE